MPIEIRELVIKATVKKELVQKNTKFLTKREWQKTKEQIIEECMDKVRELLDERVLR